MKLGYRIKGRSQDEGGLDLLDMWTFCFMGREMASEGQRRTL